PGGGVGCNGFQMICDQVEHRGFPFFLIKKNAPHPGGNRAFSKTPQRSVGGFVLLEHAGFDELVDELLHGVEGSQEALGRHDDAFRDFGGGGGTVFAGLQGDKVETNHVTGEMDLTDTVSKDFFLSHNNTSFFLWEHFPLVDETNITATKENASFFPVISGKVFSDSAESS
ncbi:MAG: hypothetical protein J6R85_05755, partial [Lentisphaeria bacterium]|nr:hypothetical protein [Lentisphaeria bacterium]